MKDHDSGVESLITASITVAIDVGMADAVGIATDGQF